MMTAWLTFTTGRLYASLWLYKRLLALEHNREDPTLVLARDPSGALLLHSKLLLMAEFLLFNKIPERERKREREKKSFGSCVCVCVTCVHIFSVRVIMPRDTTRARESPDDLAPHENYISISIDRYNVRV